MTYYYFTAKTQHETFTEIAVSEETLQHQKQQYRDTFDDVELSEIKPVTKPVMTIKTEFQPEVL